MFFRVILFVFTILSDMYSFPLKSCDIDNKEILFVIDCRHEVSEQFDFIDKTVEYLRSNKKWTSLNVSYMTYADKEPTSLEVLTSSNTTDKVKEISTQCNETLSLCDLFIKTKLTSINPIPTLRLNFVFIRINQISESVTNKIFTQQQNMSQLVIQRKLRDKLIFTITEQIQTDFTSEIFRKNIFSSAIPQKLSEIFIEIVDKKEINTEIHKSLKSNMNDVTTAHNRYVDYFYYDLIFDHFLDRRRMGDFYPYNRREKKCSIRDLVGNVLKDIISTSASKLAKALVIENKKKLRNILTITKHQMNFHQIGIKFTNNFTRNVFKSLREDINIASECELNENNTFEIARNIRNNFFNVIEKDLKWNFITLNFEKLIRSFNNAIIKKINNTLIRSKPNINVISKINKKFSHTLMDTIKEYITNNKCREIGNNFTNAIETELKEHFKNLIAEEISNIFNSNIVNDIRQTFTTEINSTLSENITKMFVKNISEEFIRALVKEQTKSFIREIVVKQDQDNVNKRFFILNYGNTLSSGEQRATRRRKRYDRTETKEIISQPYFHYTTSVKHLNILDLFPNICYLKCTNTNYSFVSEEFQRSFYHAIFKERISPDDGMKYCKTQFNTSLISIETYDELNYVISSVLKTDSVDSTSYNILLGLVIKSGEPFVWSSGNPVIFPNIQVAEYKTQQCVYINYTIDIKDDSTIKHNIWNNLHMSDCNQIINKAFIICECSQELQWEKSYLYKPSNTKTSSGLFDAEDVVSFVKKFFNDSETFDLLNCTDPSYSSNEENYYFCTGSKLAPVNSPTLILEDLIKHNCTDQCLDLVKINIKTNLSLIAKVSDFYWGKKVQLHSNQFKSQANIVGVNGKSNSAVCLKCLNMYDERCNDNTHLQNCTRFKCPTDYIKCPDSYCVPLSTAADDKHRCILGQEKMLFKQSKPICSATITIKLRDVCITSHFINKLDISMQRNFDSNCTINSVCLPSSSKDTLIRIRKMTIQLFNISNVLIPKEEISLFSDYVQFIEISIPNCKIENLKKTLLHWNTADTVKLDLSNNSISHSANLNFVLKSMTNLLFLNLSRNIKLRVLKKCVFTDSLQVVDLSYTSLESLPRICFKNITNLRLLNLSYTRIHQFKMMGLPINYNLYILNIEGLMMTEITENFFKGLTVHTSLHSSDFRLCCSKILGNNISPRKCYAPDDAISSCKNLVRDTLKRVCIWVIGLMTIAGNGIVLMYRVVWSRQKTLQTAYGLFVTGLAISDFFMGVYLMIIAVVDIMYADAYVVYDASWRKSYLCYFSGFLSTLSSETSTFFIGLITLDRFINISSPLRAHTSSQSVKWRGFIMSWVIGFVLALIPVVVPEWQIYSSNGLCLALPLSISGAGERPGWEFSMSIYVILNFILFIFIALGQAGIFVNVIKSRNLPSLRHCSKRRNQDMKIAQKLAFIALSDFLCWFPIGIMGILSMNDQEFDKEVYAWIAVFVLPINSALNPMIYTIPVIIDRLKSTHCSRT